MRRNGLHAFDDEEARVALAPDELAIPHDLDAERGILGAVIADCSALSTVRAILEPGDFFRASHQVLYRAILDLAARGPFDVVLLWRHLEDRGLVGAVGGARGFDDVLGGGAVGLIDRYALAVRELARRRGLIALANRLRLDASAGADAVGDLVVRMGRQLTALATAGARGRRAELVRLADVEPEPIHWLWPGRIPLGKPTLIAGDPGLGKSFLTIALAAAVTTGAPWPDVRDWAVMPGSAVILSAEDALGDTIRPRLDAAGADVTRVHALTGVRLEDGSLDPFSLRADLPRLGEVLDGLGDVRLVVIDPVSAYLGFGTDEHRNAEVRGLIAPLSELAERHRVAMVLITHLNKSPGGKAIYRATGSLAFVAAARMAWLVVKDKDDPARRLLLPAKSNIVAEPTGLAYRLVDGTLQWEPDAIPLHADDALAVEGGRGRPAEASTRAADWLRDYLATGPIRAKHAIEAGEAAGHARRTLFRAKDAIGALTDEAAEGKVWRLPD